MTDNEFLSMRLAEGTAAPHRHEPAIGGRVLRRILRRRPGSRRQTGTPAR